MSSTGVYGNRENTGNTVPHPIIVPSKLCAYGLPAMDGDATINDVIVKLGPEERPILEEGRRVLYY